MLAAPVFAQTDSVVVFNEVHYHPSDDASGLEYVELFNQLSVDVDLSGWRLEGVGTFVFPRDSVAPAGGFVVVAQDPGRLKEATGYSDALGPWPGDLANDGETLVLRNHNGRSMDELEYNDRIPWPPGADGSGMTLVKTNAYTASGDPRDWRESSAPNGTPGATNAPVDYDTGIVITEVEITETSYAVELTNRSQASVAVEDLGLLIGSEALTPENVTIPGDGLVVLNGPLANPLEGPVNIHLTASDGARFIDSLRVGPGVWGRRPGAPEDREFFPLQNSSLGAPDSFVGDDRIVVNEIMYHYAPNYTDPSVPDSTFEENDEEWIELTNRSAEAVDLSGWRIGGGIEFVFPEGTMIGPGAFLVVTKDAAAFSEKWPDVSVVGDFTGGLGNGGDHFRLYDGNGWLADEVRYFDDAPWPRFADGGGCSMELIHPMADNSLPESWRASDESGKSEWHDYSYRVTALRPVYTANVRSFHELRLGLLRAGECMIDDIRVVRDPDGEAKNLTKNSGFDGNLFIPINRGHWRMIGNHQRSEIVGEEEGNGGKMHVVAVGSSNYLNNLIETTLTEEIEAGTEYEIAFRAKWLRGSPQFRAELYYNKATVTSILRMPAISGTPGAVNSVAVENPGPDIAGVLHSPPVPQDGEAITVSARVDDSDGVEAVLLHYREGDDDWTTVEMTGSDGDYQGTIPGHDRNDVIQFYVEAMDSEGQARLWPVEGPASGAYVRVDSLLADSRGKRGFRINMRASEGSALHRARDILSNDRYPCTVIGNETDVFYNCGVRLRGSMFSRGNGADAGLNIKFPADNLYRGVHGTATIRRRNVQEILVKHMANQAVNVAASYNDLVQMKGYLGGHTGVARMELTRFGSLYLGGMEDDRDRDGTIFKMEGIRDFQTTDTGEPDGVKLPMPIGWIRTFDFANLGEKEQYRHVVRINSSKARDDYARVIAMCEAFSLPDSELHKVEEVIDIDQWMRMLAIQTLCGIADVYPVENPHNFNLHVPFGDGKIMAIPWDWDFTFNLAANSRIYDPRGSNKNLWRISETPRFRRLYEGHLQDLINTTFNENYARRWFQHYGEVAGASYSSHVSYVSSRASGVRSQLMDTVRFSIATSDGADLTVDTPTVTLEGKGWINVRYIRHEETGELLPIEWLDDETWRVSVPLVIGENPITLQSLDFQMGVGSIFTPMGKDSLTVTYTGNEEVATADNLVISELMYHPGPSSDEEIAAGYDDSDFFEFIELTNIGAHPVQLGGARFDDGVRFVFSDDTELAPGSSIVVVSNAAAFRMRYGDDATVAGEYVSGGLSNGGEIVRLVGANETVIAEFKYDDDVPWPVEADGGGQSLELASLEARPGYGDSTQWRASTEIRGSPGVTGGGDGGKTYQTWVESYFGNDVDQAKPGADIDGDGLNNLLEYVFGGAPDRADSGQVGRPRISDNRTLVFRSHAGSDVELSVEWSDDATDWTAVTSADPMWTETELSDGVREIRVALSGDSVLGRVRVGME